MGNRGNIIVRSGKKEIFFYTHWCGSEMAFILKSALERGKERWGDPSYLNRIIFEEMIKNDKLGITGYGICFEEEDHDAGNPYIVVDHDEEKVMFYKDLNSGSGMFFYLFFR